MNRNELEEKLASNNVPDRWYSINEGLKSNACNIFKNYDKWEYFFLDEKGERNDFGIFLKEEDVYDHLWEKMKYQLSVFNINPIK